jgi:hypothetical protein
VRKYARYEPVVSIPGAVQLPVSGNKFGSHQYAPAIDTQAVKKVARRLAVRVSEINAESEFCGF